MKRRLVFLILVIVSIVALFKVLTPISFRLMGHLLQYERLMNNPEIIIVLSGDTNKHRTKKAIELFKQTPDAKLLITGGKLYSVSVSELMRDFALEQGVPTDSILLEDQSTSTYENAINSLALIQAMNLQKVLIVTSRYHTRRSFYVFNSVFGSYYQLGIVAADDGIDYSNWWNNSRNSETVFIEFAKLLWYKLKIL